MKTFAILLATIVVSANGLSQPAAVTGRRVFLSTAAATAVSVAIATQPAAAASDPYALDLDASFKTEKVVEKKAGNGGALVGGAFAGGLALSLPFFAPNLARMAGIKNAKQPKK